MSMKVVNRLLKWLWIYKMNIKDNITDMYNTVDNIKYYKYKKIIINNFFNNSGTSFLNY